MEPYVAATLNIVTIVVDALMVLFILREPLSYFRPYKSYFVAIYVFFNAFPISQLILVFYPDEFLIRLSAQAFAAAAAIIATLWGLLVTKLYFYPEEFSLRSALANPLRKTNLPYLLYLLPMITLVILAIADTTSIDPSASRVAVYVFDNTSYRAVGFSNLLLDVAAIVITTFTVYPFVMLFAQIVLIYEHDYAKITPIARFVNEGVNQQNRVLYFHFDDEAAAREELSRNGVDVKYNLTKGNLRLPSIDSLYQGANLLDEEAAIGQCQELANETRALGKNGLRIVIDYSDRTKRPYQKFVNHIADPRWATPDHYVQVMMTFASHAFENEKTTLDLLKSKVPVIDLTESTDVFSRTVGLSHDEIAGQKILLEYDPLSGYEKILRTLATEAASNFERVILFTRKDSPIHSAMEDEPGLKMFVLTSRVSYPKVESENVILIPAFDSSLILDSMNKTIEAYAATPFTMIFDNISHQIFTLGTERAHSFVRQGLELMVSDRITGVFLLNYPAHDPKTVSMFENLFDLELVSRPGARIPEVRKKLSLTVT